MLRRSFLKILGFGGAAIAADSALPTTYSQFHKLDVPGPNVASARLAKDTPLVREVCQYSVNTDDFVARYDVMLPDEQYHVAFHSEARGYWDEGVETWLEKNRPLAKDVISQRLRDKGLTWSAVKRAPLPEGVVRARYI